jgi:hypothetical protein
LYFTSTSAKTHPDKIITPQQRKNKHAAGKKPLAAVSTGSPSIPAPTEVPTIKRIAKKNFILP